MPFFPTHRELLDVAVEAALEAGRITLQYFQTSSFETEIKADNSPVTIADRRAEQRLIEVVHRHYPAHAILGEESGETSGSEPVTWIVDPIDGTKTFICGVPFYGVLIGVEIAGSIDVGVANFPALGEIYYAARGLGAYWNGRRIRVSQTGSLADAVMLTTDMQRVDRDPEKHDAHQRLIAATKMYRTWGDCYGHMLVASGRAEIMLDPKMSVWDAAALKPIVEEAGGIFTDWSGLPTARGGSAISTNAALRGAVQELLR
ncbi:MAG TPA: inositol monophosphatase family protein [Candidatus Kapabacteria bacterium]|nr:inositol monophosphatase family protein [Candidatus Kapabacteria bacterium]